MKKPVLYFEVRDPDEKWELLYAALTRNLCPEDEDFESRLSFRLDETIKYVTRRY